MIKLLLSKVFSYGNNSAGSWFSSSVYHAGGMVLIRCHNNGQFKASNRPAVLLSFPVNFHHNLNLSCNTSMRKTVWALPYGPRPRRARHPGWPLPGVPSPGPPGYAGDSLPPLCFWCYLTCGYPHHHDYLCPVSPPAGSSPPSSGTVGGSPVVWRLQTLAVVVVARGCAGGH